VPRPASMTSKWAPSPTALPRVENPTEIAAEAKAEKRRPAPSTLADRRLLGFLVKAGKLERSEAEVAVHRSQGVSVIDFLAEGHLTEAEIAESVARGLGLPLIRLSNARIDEWAADLVDEAAANRFALIAITADDEIVTLAMANPFDQEAIKFVEFATGRRVRRAVATYSEILDTIAKAYGHEETLASVLADVPQDGSLELISSTSSPQAHDVDASKLAREAEQAPIIKMVNLILVDALGAQASDIHIEPGPNVVLVRYRIDGMLVDGHQLPKWVQNPLTARIKIMAKADITERRTPQDGHFTLRHDGRLVDVRVSVLPTTDGEKFVLRLLDPNGSLRTLDQLGMSERDCEKIRQLLQKSEGMILVTGPTGSGKTSTLCAMISEAVSPRRNVVTIENPVEFNLKGVSQVDINDKQGLTFATVLRSVLRQDPDVIMVGEIRDRETAEVAFRAAQTGHLVLSTLHTNDTAATITRLLDIGIEPYLIAPALVAIVAQRLVRKICEHCAESATAEIPRLGRDRSLREGRGCSACHGTGFSGRTGCYEVLEVTKGIQRLIESKAPESQIRGLAEEEGMRSIRENALAKVEAGATTTDEAMRVVQMEVRGLQCPHCLNSVEEHFIACPHCRHPLRSACGACGMTLKKKWASCPYCGAAASESTPAEATTEPPRTALADPVAERASTRQATPAIEAPGGSSETPRILVVDDYADVRLLLRVALQAGENAVTVQEAESGAEALAMIEKEKPHLVILDLMMPGMDGYEVCRRLRSDLATAFIPILMLTALSDPKSKSLGFLAGTDDYLVKPFENAELRARVTWLLQRSYRLRPAGGGVK
jgi:type II secretory ATPase GspE/PulE/Tfp pilus assembly ATPase PilB-like protein